MVVVQVLITKVRQSCISVGLKLTQVVRAVVGRGGVGAVGIRQTVTSTVGDRCCIRSVCNWSGVAQQYTSLVPWCILGFCAHHWLDLFGFNGLLCSVSYSEESQKGDSLKTENNKNSNCNYLLSMHSLQTIPLYRIQNG